MTTKILTAVIFIFCLSLTNGQNSSNSAGQNATTASGNVSYSIGELFYESSSGTGGNLLPGVQQPYIITETLGSDITEINLKLNIYPNPATDLLILNVGFDDYKKYSYELYDYSGKFIQQKNIDTKSNQINMSVYPSATYLLKVVKNGKLVKIFKVLKKDK